MNGFKPGHTINAHLKGKKETDFRTPDHIAKLKKVRWQPGQSGNSHPEGTISVHIHRKGRNVKKIKVNGKQVLLHRHVWTQANGPIPPGHIITFRDKDQMNCDLTNLELTTASTRIRQHPASGYPPELSEAMRTIKQLQKAITKKVNEKVESQKIINVFYQKVNRAKNKRP